MATNLLRTGMAAAAAALAAHASDAVAYLRGTTRIALAATPGRSTFQVDRGGGVLEAVETADWIVADADLGGLVPQAGDRIERPAATGPEIYEVLDVGGGVGCRSPMGLAGTLTRVHTKRLAP